MDYVRYAAKLSAAFFIGCFGLLIFVSSVAGNFNALGAMFGGVVIAAAWFTWPRRPNAWKLDPPTERQLAYASDLGIDIPAGATKGDVSALITARTGR